MDHAPEKPTLTLTQTLTLTLTLTLTFTLTPTPTLSAVMWAMLRRGVDAAGRPLALRASGSAEWD